MPGSCLVCGEAEVDASPEDRRLDVTPANEDRSGGFTYLIRQDRPLAADDCPLHLATGIQRLAESRLMAAAPELAVVLRLLTSPDLLRVAPHLEI